MTFRTIPYNFHDGHLRDFSVGPRNEVTLHIALNPVWNQKQDCTVLVRFGAIRNFDAVVAFFGKLERPNIEGRSIAEVVCMVHSGVRKDAMYVGFSPGEGIEIQSRHVTFD